MPNWDEVHRYALQQATRNAKSLEDAQDIAQGVVKKLYIKDLRIRAWRSYVRTMVINAVTDLYRKDEREQRDASALPEPGDYLWSVARDIYGRSIDFHKPRDLSIEIAENELVLEILAEVSAQHREMFIDHLEGVPSAELAKIYGYASAASVNQTISRIKTSLRQKFEGANLEG